MATECRNEGGSLAPDHKMKIFHEEILACLKLGPTSPRSISLLEQHTTTTMRQYYLQDIVMACSTTPVCSLSIVSLFVLLCCMLVCEGLGLRPV
eukprot:5195522-Amphidinium_carterae.2